MKTFKDFGLSSDIIKGLDDLGFTEPTPIQEKAIPFVLESKKDLIALAQTGTGKTAAFGLPIINQIKAEKRALQSIILCPTRELCLQISQDLKKFTKYSKGFSVTAVYGGERIELQINSLKRGTNVVVGTPGRVNDLIRRKVLKLGDIKWVVLDEADEMLDMGFKEELDAILDETPKEKQTLLFSATMSKNVKNIAVKYMGDYEELSAGEKNIGADKVTHEYYVVQSRDRFEALKRILDSLPGVYGILFCRTRRETQDVAEKLKAANYDAEPIHGEISQSSRTKIMERFKQKKVRLLVATDVAARGIDVSDLSHVINYNLPDQNETYTHRSGRTGRASKSGVSISILTAKDLRKVKDLERIIGKSIERKTIPNASDVLLKQAEIFIQKMEDNTLEEIDKSIDLSEIENRLNKINKEDLISRIIKLELGTFLASYKNKRDINNNKKADERPKIMEGGVEVKIPLGKNQRLTIKSLFEMINSNRKLKGLEIGKIKILDNHSFFLVEEKMVEIVKRELERTDFRKVKSGRGRDGGRSREGGRSSFGGRNREGGRGRDSRRKRSGERSKKFSPKTSDKRRKTD